MSRIESAGIISVREWISKLRKVDAWVALVILIVAVVYTEIAISTHPAESTGYDAIINVATASWLQVILAYLFIIPTLWLHRALVINGIIILILLGLWQSVAALTLPNNLGVSPLFLLVSWVIYTLARSLELDRRWLWGIVSACIFASFFSPVMWKISIDAAGTPHGLEYRTGMEMLVFLLLHWSVITIAMLLGSRSRSRTLARIESERFHREAERSLIAAEIHDVLAHSLTLIKMQAHSAQYDPQNANEILKSISETTGESLTEVRSIVDTLRRTEVPATSGFRDLGFAELAAKFESAGMPVDVDVKIETTEPPTQTKLALHRIATETLTNALKHQHDPEARVIIESDGDDVYLTVDSIGERKTPHVRPHRGVGLSSMRERCRALGGSLSITLGEPMNHTVVVAQIPMRKKN